MFVLIQCTLLCDRSAQDKSELEATTAEQTELKTNLRSLKRARATAEATKNKLENLLQANLLKRHEELKTVIESPVADEHTEQVLTCNDHVCSAGTAVAVQNSTHHLLTNYVLFVYSLSVGERRNRIERGRCTRRRFRQTAQTDRIGHRIERGETPIFQ